MKFEVRIGETVRHVEIESRVGTQLRVRFDGHSVEADAVASGDAAFSLLLAGRAFEARVSSAADALLVRCDGCEFHVQVRDPRQWRGGRHSALQAEGRQQIVAPMPGKVVRVLIAAGETVEAGQGLVVVEAMKMQNEIRAPKGGQVERVLVREGQAVRAQEPLVVIA